MLKIETPIQVKHPHIRIHKREKKPRQKSLKAAFAGLLSVLRRKPQGTLSVHSREIFESANIPARTFLRNFQNADDVLYYAYEDIADVFEREGDPNPESAPNLNAFLSILLIRLRQHQDSLLIALEKQDRAFWHEAILPLKPILTFNWSQRSPEAVAHLFRMFADEFCDVLLQWARKGFDETVLPECISILKHILFRIGNEAEYWEDTTKIMKLYRME